MTRILLADDDPLLTRSLAEIFRTEGFEVECAGDGLAALRRLRRATFDAAIVALDMPRLDGMDFLREARTLDPDLPVIFTTGFGTVEHAVEAMRAGAFDFVAKPVMEAEMKVAVQRALDQRRLRVENRSMKAELQGRFAPGNLIGASHRMRRIFEMVEAVADTRATVLITGESGTGKTVLARAIHQASDRREGPFVEVNCGALPDSLLESELFGHVRGSFTGAIRDRTGKFEQAQGGTIFLDEVSAASPALQVKLLRVLQDRLIERVGDTRTREVDVRVVLATNSDLAEEVREGRFREDLFYRVNVFNLVLPPLRERQADIVPLARRFLQEVAAENGREVRDFALAALARILEHPWPGNVRELRNAVERAVILSRGPEVDEAHLPDPSASATVPAHNEGRPGGILPLREAIKEPEKRIIQEALARNGWNRQKTARMLEVNRTTLFNKMKKYGLLGPREGRGQGGDGGGGSR